MTTINFTQARENLAKTMTRVCKDRAPLIITRKREGAVVMMSLEDYEAMEETAYLLRSPENTRRLLKGIQQLETGRGKERQLAE